MVSVKDISMFIYTLSSKTLADYKIFRYICSEIAIK